ncbi:DUF4136 domain-containing protein [Anaeromyxobacter oryzae]|uniref:DUF4136 domain-containing protein n=1 Tax=Anaeromyxobacter oryzae TaxID=2918170 RepID=A0ABM7X1D5_9BACT|nr:DUF4136 domain-containing protein [Anaeromyxobacter oryzae]BDG05606.1 hypothetical protein AMOR_46020 [Anaeromyxobacter oryzae]
MTPARCSLLAVAAALAGCSTVKINTQYDPATPFSEYRTYAWITTAPGAEQAAPVRNPAVRAMIVTAIDREMAKRGLLLAAPDKEPDFLVSVLGWSHSRIEVTNYGYAYGGAYVYGPYGPSPVAVPVADVAEYTDGTLLLDFVDAKTHKLFWRGTATDTVTSTANVKDTIDDAVRHLLEAYPPKK